MSNLILYILITTRIINTKQLLLIVLVNKFVFFWAHLNAHCTKNQYKLGVEIQDYTKELYLSSSLTRTLKINDNRFCHRISRRYSPSCIYNGTPSFSPQVSCSSILKNTHKHRHIHHQLIKNATRSDDFPFRERKKTPKRWPLVCVSAKVECYLRFACLPSSDPLLTTSTKKDGFKFGLFSCSCVFCKSFTHSHSFKKKVF